MACISSYVGRYLSYAESYDDNTLLETLHKQREKGKEWATTNTVDEWTRIRLWMRIVEQEVHKRGLGT